MKREQLFINKLKAFSLVELLISISIFLVFVSAIMNTTVGVNRQMVHASNIERASILVGEAVEVSRNIRDNNFSNLIDGTYGLSTSTGQWVLSGSSDNSGVFTRQLTISTINTNQKKIDVLVTWPDMISNSNSVTASTYLTHWKKITPPAGLTVTKSVINHGGSKVISDFAPFTVGTTTITLASSTSFSPGTYTVSETFSSDYTESFTGDCDSSGVITLVPGDAKICLITNEEKPAKIIVNKTVVNHGQNKTAGDFTLYVDAVPVISGDLNTFDSGTHTVSESSNADYTATIGGNCSSGGAVTLVPNQTKNCSIINEEKLAYLTVNKTVINHGGTKTSSDFAPYKVGATTVTLGASTVFDSGTYTVTEATSSTHTTTFAGDCNSSGVVTLTSGSSKTCSITNEENIVYVVPTVTLPTSTSVSTSSAILGATVSSLGTPASITARGTCYGATPAPTTNCVAEGATTTGLFTQTRTGLTASTTYYYRGYATNSTGTGYSADGTFTTLPASCTGTPWGTMTSGTSNTAYASSSPSGACISELRTCTNGTLSGSYTATTCTAGCTGTPWGSVISGYFNTAYLSSSVTYPSSCTPETRTCTAGTMSGTYTNTSCSVTPVLPSVTTASPITSITRTTATGGGNVTSDGGASVTSRGIVWSTSINPTIALPTKTSDGTGTGSFTSSITALTCNTLYHVRAYATNSVGTSYGSDVTFTTSACSTITFVASSAVQGVNATIPAHNVGDLLITFAYRDGNATGPTTPSGWTVISSSGGGNANGSTLAYRIATGADSSNGWTGASEIVTHVYRGQSASPIGVNGVQSSSGTTVTYPALTLGVTNGTSWVIGFAGHRNTNTNLQNPPTGMIQRTTRVDATAEVAGHDTNGGVSSWSARNVVVGGTSGGWMTRVLEIKSQ